MRMGAVVGTFQSPDTTDVQLCQTWPWIQLLRLPPSLAKGSTPSVGKGFPEQSFSSSPGKPSVGSLMLVDLSLDSCGLCHHPCGPPCPPFLLPALGQTFRYYPLPGYS